MTGDLAGFLSAQLDEIERVARAAAHGSSGHWKIQPDSNPYGDGPRYDIVITPDYWITSGGSLEDDDSPDHGAIDNDADAVHIALHDPAFVLAWVAAQRQVVEDAVQFPTTSMRHVLRLLAEPFRGRPGWRDEWDTGHGG